MGAMHTMPNIKNARAGEFGDCKSPSPTKDGLALRSTRSTGRTSPIRADTLAGSKGVPLDLDVGYTIPPSEMKMKRQSILEVMWFHLCPAGWG